MAQTRHIIRKTQPARYHRFDDQLWPLAVAMVVLGGFLAGSVLAYLRLDDPRWYANAWTWLIAIPLVITASLGALAWSGNRLLRRTMQFSIVLGVIVHVVMLLAAIETDVFNRAWVEMLADANRPPQKQPAKVPNFLSLQTDARQRTRRDLDRPVIVHAPDPTVEEVPKEQIETPPTATEMPPQPAPQREDVPLPSVVNRPEPNQTVPRQREEMSKLSRREAAVAVRPTQLAEVPSVVPRTERRDDAPRPETMGVRPQTLAANRQPQAVPQPAQVPETSPDLQVARRQQPPTTKPADATPAAAATPRRESRSAIAPNAVAVTEVNAAQPRAQDTPSPAPQSQAVARQETRAPDTRERVEIPPAQIAAERAATRRNIEQPSPPRDTLAQTPRAVPNRQPRVTTRPDLTAVVEGALVVDLEKTPAANAMSPAAEPSATADVARDRAGQMAAAQPRAPQESPGAPATEAASPAAARRAPSAAQPNVDAVSAALPGRQAARSSAIGSLSQRVSPVASEAGAAEPSRTLAGPAASADTQIAKRAAGNTSAERPRPSAETSGAGAADQTPLAQSRRRTSAAQPSLTSLPESNSPPRRALQEASAASSPLAVESPSRGASVAERPASSAEPASMVLSKGEIGTAGRGASRNLGQGEPSADSPAAVASGSARRAQATQNAPPGPAIEPHDAALVRRGRAGLARPTTVLEANSVDPSLAAGTARTAEVQASTSAALTQAASDADRGRITAARGNLDVDTGPTTLVAEAGTGRGAGGGQPELSFGARREMVPRAQSGQAPAPSLLADTTGSSPAAPHAEGGGEPSAAAVDVGGNALVDARAGAEVAEFGGPSALGGGPSTVPTLSQANASRRGHGVLDEVPQQNESGTGVARVARKAAEDRQLPADLGVADLTAGNAADRNDGEVPASTLAASDTSVSDAQRVATGMGGNPGGQTGVRADGAAVAAPGAASAAELAARAEAVEAAPGPPVAGGGTGSPARAGRGPEVVAATAAETVEIAGSPASRGSAAAPSDDLQGPKATEIARSSTTGVGKGPTSGRAATGTAETTIGTEPGSALSRRDAAASDDIGPLAQDDTSRGPGPAKRAANVSLPSEGVTVDLADLLSPSDMRPGEGTAVALALGDPQAGPVSRLAGQALPADIEAPAGLGGLGSRATVDVGLPSRHALDSGTDLQLDAPRFNRNRLGGQPNLNPTAAMPTESFQRRIQRAQGGSEPAEGTGPQTEDAIELGLVFLSRAQLPDGRWSLDRFAKEDGLPQLASDSAATGLALLSFQGAGYNHMDFRYAQVVRRGIDFLVRNQQPDGSLFVPMDDESNLVVQFYSHSIAALAMCEAYGMTQDPMLREPAQRAIDFIVETQNAQRGGWRYTQGVSSDTSVTGWMMMALKSGELANLKVPKETYNLIDRWLDSAQASPTQPHLYCYNPFAPDSTEQRAGRAPTHTMTSVGLLMRLYLGWRRNNPAFARGAQYLARRPPAIGTKSDPQRDTYYWYYGTQVMFHMGGQYWRDWNQSLHPLLIDTQVREGALAGSWDPRRPIPDRWGAHAGRLYVTTLNLLSLEVTYRHLPLYEDTAK